MPNPTTTLTPTLIATHERLYPRLASLLKQVERVAGRQPTLPVPEESARLGRQLVGEAAKLLGPEGRGIVVPNATKAAPLDHARLAVALGQAVAGLEAFEGAHAMLSVRHQAICWLLPDGKRRPIARHLPTTPPKNAPAWGVAEHEFTEADRKKIVNRIVQRENITYLRGYRDAQDGKPPRQPLDEIEFI